MRKRDRSSCGSRSARPRMKLVMVDAGTVPRAPRRRRGSGGEAADHRRRVHPGLRGGGRQARADRLPDPGHAVSRRHRVEDRRDEDRAEDQDPPQRRWPAADLRFRLIEPLRYLFEDQVRKVGTDLACRRDGSAPAVPRSGARDPDHRRGHRGSARHAARGGLIVIDEIKAAGLYRSFWQSFAILTPVRSSGSWATGGRRERRGGASGDERRRDDRRLGTATVRGAREDLRRIVNEVPGVNRVVYDVSSKPPATIEWEWIRAPSL